MRPQGQRAKKGSRRARRWVETAEQKAAKEREARRRERQDKLRQGGNAAVMPPSRPAITPLPATYGVHMRNTPGHERGTWATYVHAAREGAMLSKAELARRLGIDRGTVHRWEIGANRPENPAVVQAVAQVLGLDLDEALAAAGLRPDVEPPAEPTREVDEEIDLVRTDPRLSDDMKQRIVKLILERRERDRVAAIEETRRMIDLFGRI